MNRYKHFPTKVLGLVESKFRNFMHDAIRAPSLKAVEFMTLDAYIDIAKLIKGGSRDIPLYCNALVAKLTAKSALAAAQPAAAAKAQGQDQQAKDGSPPKKARVEAVNPTPIQEWAIKENNVISRVIKKMRTEPFEINGTTVCINYHCQGICRAGNKCLRKATHEPITGNEKAKFGEWLKKAQEEKPKNNPKPAE